MISTRDAKRRLDAVLPQMGEEAAKTRLPPATGAMSFEGVWAKPPESDRVVLSNVSFQAQPGEVLAVLGPSGAGKSTLIRMASGAGRPERGAVRLDGAALSDWPADQLAEAIGYLPQDFVLFPGTIKENISRFANHRGVDPAQVDALAIAAATAVKAHEMILRLPQGYDTEIGFNGAGLSAGQRQRIALARAFYGDPKILILDEPNAHLDPEGEASMIEALRQARARGASAIMVVHRGGAIRVADKVLVMRDGQVQAFGPAAEIVPGLAPAPQPAPQPQPRPTPAPAPMQMMTTPPRANDEYRLRA
jgi:ATP-binding cassette subfamily C protein